MARRKGSAGLCGPPPALRREGYFFLGPLFCIGGFLVAFSLFPPFLDTGYLLSLP